MASIKSGGVASSGAMEQFGQARSYFAAGENARAKEILLSLLERGKLEDEYMADAYNDLGVIFFEDGDSANALGCFEEAVKLNPQKDDAFAHAGDLFVKENLGLQALDSYIRAIQIKPDNVSYRDKFIGVAGNYCFKMFLPNLKAVLLDCMQRPEVDLTGIDTAWISILSVDPAFSEGMRLIAARDYKGFLYTMANIESYESLIDPLFLAGLKRIRFFNLEWEVFLTNVRRYLLENISADDLFSGSDTALKLAAHVALYCYKTDYIFDVDKSEEQLVYTLKNNIEQGDYAPLDLAVLGCYMPIYRLENSKSVMEGDIPPLLYDLIEQQIKGYFRLKEIEKDIPVLAEIKNDVSLSVQNQYEESPYPRWTDFSKLPYNEEFEGKNRNNNDAKILVAGCGTGREAIELATVNPNADIVAVDLSKTSLSYGIKRARELGIDNINFQQADILGLSVLERGSFDFIASSGVLHHMEAPKKGWSVLKTLLKDDGVMRIGLYSAIARSPIIRAQEIIKGKGLSATPGDIRKFRKNMRKWLSRDDCDHILSRGDFYTTSECRDLFFHVQEKCYNLSEIKYLLADIGLEFLGFHLPPPVLEQYRGDNLSQDSEYDLDLDRWELFEGKNPQTFAAMYNFWCKKI